MKTVWRVHIIESERGWGQKIDETLWFENEDLATHFVNEFNARNTAATTPDIYWKADLPYGMSYPDESEIVRTMEEVEKRVPPKMETTLASGAARTAQKRSRFGVDAVLIR